MELQRLKVKKKKLINEGFFLDWQADEWAGLELEIQIFDTEGGWQIHENENQTCEKEPQSVGKQQHMQREKKKNNKATNNKFHMDDKIPESSVWCWRGMGLDAFLQGGTENILV